MSTSKAQDVGAGVVTLRLRTLRPNMMSSVCAEGGHDLSACSRFKAMSRGERPSFVWGKELYFCCFDGRHVASQCRAGVVCGVEACTAKHSKSLHQSFMGPVKEDFGEQQATLDTEASSRHVESHAHARSSPRQGQTKLELPIVPVKVRPNGQTAYITRMLCLIQEAPKPFVLNL